ncbi:MAG: AraC family transcriptional regulator [Solirubrobacteraceae bacterium]
MRTPTSEPAGVAAAAIATAAPDASAGAGPAAGTDATAARTVGPGAVDRLTGLLRRFEVEVSVLDAADPLTAPRGYGDGASPLGYLHVLSRGAIRLEAPGPPREGRQVAQPSLVLCAGPTPHRIVPIGRPAVTCAALRFVDGAVNPLLRALPRVLVVGTSVPGVAPTLALLQDEVEQVRCGRPLVAGRLMEVVLLRLLRWVFDHPDEAGVPPGLVRGMADPGIAASLVAIHDDPAGDWTLERMARVATLSRSAYAERFRVLVGEPPGAYLASYRIALAQQRLLRGDQVATIAADVGYANGSGLSRAFTARTGRSPSAWLAEVAEGPVGGPPAASLSSDDASAPEGARVIRS